MYSALVAAVAVVTCACAIPFAIPPVRGEVGAASQLGAGRGSHLQAAVGVHYASGTESARTPLDVGVGYIVEHDAETEPAASQGLYVDASRFVVRRGHARAGLGGRGEVLWTPEGTAAAAKLRIDYEMFTGGRGGFSGRDRCGTMGGVAHGTGAVGMFTEIGPTYLPGGVVAWTASAGVTARIPAVLGVWVGIPGC